MKTTSENSYPKLGVGVIVLRNRKVLLGRRKGPRNPGEYGLPGGFLEKDESIEMCALREIDEETGLSSVVVYPLSPLRWSDAKNHYLDFIFLAKHKIGEPIVRESDRVEKWIWSDLLDLPSPLYKPSFLALERFIHDHQFNKLRLLVQKWMFRHKKIILFEDR